MKKIAIFLLLIVSTALVFNSCKDARIEYKKGALTATTFESEYLDLKFTVPTGYTLATEEETLKLLNQGADIVGMNSDLLDYAKATTVYEMQATSSTGFPNVIVMVEKLALSNMTVDTYLDAIKKQLTGISTIQYSIGSTTGKQTIAGKEYTKMIATATYGNISSTQEYFCRIQDGRAISLVLTYTSDTASQKDTLLNAFTAFK